MLKKVYLLIVLIIVGFIFYEFYYNSPKNKAQRMYETQAEYYRLIHEEKVKSDSLLKEANRVYDSLVKEAENTK